MKGFIITILWCAAWFAIISALNGCAEYPIAIRIQGNHGTYGYSAKGITIDIHADK